MFFPCGIFHRKQKRARKEKRILPGRHYNIRHRERRFPGMSCRGSMTLEAACTLPLFLFAMLSILQFSQVTCTSSRLLAGMQDTAKEMAVYAGIQELGISAGEGVPAELLRGGISAVYARGKIRAKSGFHENAGTFSLAQSVFLKNEIIDVSVLYYPKQAGLLPVPKIKAALRARVRAWTGRTGSKSGEEGQEEDKEEETVYVAVTGKVYHKDENCSHIRLSIQTVARERLKTKRNASGGKYHACERCGGGTGASVYVTAFGDRYHSSLSCSGLKRSVKEVPISQVKGWRACTKCGRK